MSEWAGPSFRFASKVGNAVEWFAWLPVRTWDKRVRWLTKVRCQYFVKHEYLDGPQIQFWAYEVIE